MLGIFSSWVIDFTWRESATLPASTAVRAYRGGMCRLGCLVAVRAYATHAAFADQLNVLAPGELAELTALIDRAGVASRPHGTG